MKRLQPVFKRTYILVTAFCLLLACTNGQEEDPEKLLAGENSKTWKTDQKHTASGNERSLTQADGDQQIQFNADGTFQISDGSETQRGSWTYRPTERMLELSFENQPGIIESFYVTRLEENSLDVRDPDGATMQFTAE